MTEHEELTKAQAEILPLLDAAKADLRDTIASFDKAMRQIQGLVDEINAIARRFNRTAATSCMLSEDVRVSLDPRVVTLLHAVAVEPEPAPIAARRVQIADALHYRNHAPGEVCLLPQHEVRKLLQATPPGCRVVTE